MKNKDRPLLKDFMDVKLVNKLRLYTVIMVVMVLVVSAEVIRSKFSPELAVEDFSLEM